MKFRHPTGVRIALTTGYVALVGPKWRELHVDAHREALAKGCECDQTTIRTQTPAPPVGGEGAVVPLEEKAAIRAALIAMITRNGEEDFTKAGTPMLKTLAKEVGFEVEKETALAVWHELEAEAQAAADAQAAAEAATNAGGGEG